MLVSYQKKDQSFGSAQYGGFKDPGFKFQQTRDPEFKFQTDTGFWIKISNGLDSGLRFQIGGILDSDLGLQVPFGMTMT